MHISISLSLSLYIYIYTHTTSHTRPRPSAGQMETRVDRRGTNGVSTNGFTAFV